MLLVQLVHVGLLLLWSSTFTVGLLVLWSDWWCSRCVWDYWLWDCYCITAPTVPHDILPPMHLLHHSISSHSCNYCTSSHHSISKVKQCILLHHSTSTPTCTYCTMAPAVPHAATVPRVPAVTHELTAPVAPCGPTAPLSYMHQLYHSTSSSTWTNYTRETASHPTCTNCTEG